MERDAHEPDRSGGPVGGDTHLFDERQLAGSQLDRLFRPGERVRLRFINGAANTFYDVRIPGLKLTVVQADGQNVRPVKVRELRMGNGETYDVIVQPKDDAYTIFAQSMDRTGYARGTLAVREGAAGAPVPALDPAGGCR